MLLSRDAITAAVEARVEAADFYKPAHGHIYDAIMVALRRRASRSTRSPSPRSCAGPTCSTPSAARAALLQLQAATPASANAAHYAQDRQRARAAAAAHRRRRATSPRWATTTPDDVTETLDRAESMVFEVAERRVSDSMVGCIRRAQQTARPARAACYGDESELTGVPTGYHDLDELLLGLQPSTLIDRSRPVPARARPRSRSGAAANVAIESRRPVLFFSMEMGTLELTKRLLAAEARVDARKLQTGKLNEADWSRLTTRSAASPRRRCSSTTTRTAR